MIFYLIILIFNKEISLKSHKQTPPKIIKSDVSARCYRTFISFQGKMLKFAGKDTPNYQSPSWLVRGTND